MVKVKMFLLWYNVFYNIPARSEVRRSPEVFLCKAGAAAQYSHVGMKLHLLFHLLQPTLYCKSTP